MPSWKPVVKENQRNFKAAAGDQEAENRLGCNKRCVDRTTWATTPHKKTREYSGPGGCSLAQTTRSPQNCGFPSYVQKRLRCGDCQNATQ